MNNVFDLPRVMFEHRMRICQKSITKLHSLITATRGIVIALRHIFNLIFQLKHVTCTTFIHKHTTTPLYTARPQEANALRPSAYRSAKNYNKWRAVAAQTARCHRKVLCMQYVYYFRAYQRQWNGRQIIR